jgi:ZIP family zinc transporter
MDPLYNAMILTIIAGVAILLGAFVVRWERIRPYWLEREFRHGVVAFGSGVLLAAVALVLIPEGVRLATGLGGAQTCKRKTLWTINIAASCQR